jgi:hypothetical protein
MKCGEFLSLGNGLNSHSAVFGAMNPCGKRSTMSKNFKNRGKNFRINLRRGELAMINQPNWFQVLVVLILVAIMIWLRYG